MAGEGTDVVAVAVAGGAVAAGEAADPVPGGDEGPQRCRGPVAGGAAVEQLAGAGSVVQGTQSRSAASCGPAVPGSGRGRAAHRGCRPGRAAVGRSSTTAAVCAPPQEHRRLPPRPAAAGTVVVAVLPWSSWWVRCGSAPPLPQHGVHQGVDPQRVEAGVGRAGPWPGGCSACADGQGRPTRRRRRGRHRDPERLHRRRAAAAARWSGSRWPPGAARRAGRVGRRASPGQRPAELGPRSAPAPAVSTRASTVAATSSGRSRTASASWRGLPVAHLPGPKHGQRPPAAGPAAPRPTPGPAGGLRRQPQRRPDLVPGLLPGQPAARRSHPPPRPSRPAAARPASPGTARSPGSAPPGPRRPARPGRPGTGTATESSPADRAHPPPAHQRAGQSPTARRATTPSTRVHSPKPTQQGSDTTPQPRTRCATRAIEPRWSGTCDMALRAVSRR